VPITAKKRREVLFEDVGLKLFQGEVVACRDANDNFLAEKISFAGHRRDYSGTPPCSAWQKEGSPMSLIEHVPGKFHQAQHTPVEVQNADRRTRRGTCRKRQKQRVFQPSPVKRPKGKVVPHAT
jgi:hypothetical protein